MKVTILCGVSGSGKSTYARGMEPTHERKHIISADDHFMVDGEYRFDPSQLPAAHAHCLRRFADHVCHCESHNVGLLVVDNTNTTVAEIAPYAALAQAYGCELEILIFNCDPEVALERNVHSVPRRAICGQYRRIQGLQDEMPPWWPARQIL